MPEASTGRAIVPTSSRGGTPIETLYGDVPPKWVGFDKKSLNMGPIFGPKIPKHGFIFFKFSENLFKNSLFLEQNP